MKLKRIVSVTLALAVSAVLISCGPTSTSTPTPEPATLTDIPLAASAIPVTEEPSTTPLPTEIPQEPAQATDQQFVANPLPAAPPHLKAGEKLTLDFIHMANITDGWGISGPSILITRDSGKSWQEVSPPETLPVGSLAKAYGTFPDEKTAWVIYGIDQTGSTDPAYAYYQIQNNASVWSTTDGGKTWVASPPLMHEAIGDWTWAEFTVLDDTTGWMMVRGVYLGAGTHYNAQFFQTLDGVSWQPIPGGNLGVDYTGMVFADEDYGWLTWQTTGAYAAGPPEYAVTDDGGFNWETHELPPPEDAPDLFNQYEYCEPYQPNLLSNQSVRLLVACFDYYDPPRKFVSYLYSSEDAGGSWNIFPLPEKVNGSKSTLIFFDDNNTQLLGRDMYRSEDDGETWTFIKTVSWDGQFTFIDDQTGWAVATNDNREKALVQTTNGGKTWSRLDPVVAQ